MVAAASEAKKDFGAASILRKPFDIEMLSAVLVELAQGVDAKQSGGNVIDFPGKSSVC